MKDYIVVYDSFFAPYELRHRQTTTPPESTKLGLEKYNHY